MMRMENRMKVARLVFDDCGRNPAPDYRPGRAPSQVAQISQVVRLRAVFLRGLLDVIPLYGNTPTSHFGLRNVHPLLECGGELERRACR